MNARNYKVSVGLPVYNGENYIRKAIDSYLAQSFDDFELIISDNASSDATEAICRDYARRDRRIQYHRNDTNLGASRNYTKVFQSATGQYFKWAAHDDECHPDYLRKAVDVLDQDDSIILCHALTRIIDGEGRLGPKVPATPGLSAADPYQRFRTALPSVPIWVWGLMRRSVLAKTRLLGNYPKHDRPLVAELCLRGRIYEIPEYLVFEREHPQRSIHVHDFRNPHGAVVWFDPANAGKLFFPEWRLLAEYISAVRRGPIAWHDKARCYGEILRWTGGQRSVLFGDLVTAASRVPIGGRVLSKGWHHYWQVKWAARTRRMVKAVGRAIPPERTFVLVDDYSLSRKPFTKWQILSLPGEKGQHSGPPKDDEEAVRRVEALGGLGVDFIVLAWPAFWWLDIYVGLRKYLEEKALMISKTPDVIVFELNAESKVRKE